MALASKYVQINENRELAPPCWILLSQFLVVRGNDRVTGKLAGRRLTREHVHYRGPGAEGFAVMRFCIIFGAVLR